ncbi:MAG: Uma2 family endonuclease [Kiritimatiellae bacterium]|nr:Uma2 family endonuclease [Kiritimatiellia bacterium]
MGKPALKDTGFTWSDYRSWDGDERYELIGGEVHAMSPAPSTRHQRIQQELGRQLGNHFMERPCDIYPAPVDVKLSDLDIVQPDLVVVCDEERIKPTHIDGPPTLVIEILSPATATYDRTRKLDLYARSGVKEVWLITPYPSCIEVYLLDGSTYRLIHACGKDDALQSPTFPDLELDLLRLFDVPLEPGEEIQRVKEVHPPYATDRKAE